MRRRSQVSEHQPLVPQVEDTSRKGTTVRIRGERGTFRLHAEVLTEAGAEWVECFQENVGWRFFKPERVVWPRPKKGTK